MFERELNRPGTPLLDLMPKEKLIINFGEDSSEDDETNATLKLPPITDIDFFLRDAKIKTQNNSIAMKSPKKKVYKTVNRVKVVNKLSYAQQIEYRKLKEEIARREQTGNEKEAFLKIKESRWKTSKALLEHKRQKMFEMKSKVIQKRIQLRKAQNHARKMQEMFVAATRIVTTTAAELNTFNSELKVMDTEVQSAEKNLSSLEKECLSVGQLIRGNDYKLPTYGNNKIEKKIVAPLRKRRLKSESEKTENKVKSNQKLVDEKKRLSELKVMVKERLQSMKRPAAQQKTGIENNVHSKLKEKSADKEDNGKEHPDKVKRFSTALSTSVNRHLRKPFISNVCVPYEYKLNFVTYPSEFRSNCSQIDFQMPIHSVKTEANQLSTNSELDITKEDEYCVLSHLHSFRLSTLFEKQAIRNSQQPDYTSTRYSNAINPDEYLCRFDLMGTCNDEECPWQHSRNYSFVSDDKLVDLLLYNPSIAQLGANNGISSPLSIQQFHEFITKFRKEHTEKSEYELKQLLVSLIRSSESKASMCSLKRCLPRVKPRSVINNSIHTFDDFKYCIKLRDSSLTLTYGKVFRMRANTDPDNFIKNRFFAPEGRPVSAELETTLASDPNNIQLWVKLAYYHVTRNPRNKADCINKALNVLSRGLESNQMNAELWEHYLMLYANRVLQPDEESKFDLLNVCSRAVSVCPHQKIWKMYLSFCVSMDKKEEICSKFLVALSSGMVLFDDRSEREFSHCLLEVMTYKVRLFLESAQLDKAEDFLRYVLLGEGEFVKQNFLSSVEVIDAVLSESNQNCKRYNSLASLMTLSDRVFAWLCYLYFCYFQTLPFENFEVFRQSFSGLVYKSTFVFDWKKNTPNEKQISDILAIFKTAIDQCLVFDGNESDHLIQCLPLIVNIINFQVHGVEHSIENGIRIYDSLIETFPRCAQLRFLKAELLMEHNLPQCAIDTLKRNLLISSERLNTYYLIAIIHYEMMEFESCRRTLLDAVNDYYSRAIERSELFVAYRCLMLDEELNEIRWKHYKPLLKFDEDLNEIQWDNYKLLLKFGDSSRPIKLWLCYLLVNLIESRPDSEIEKCFQHAVTLCKLHVSSENEINLLWWLYLRHSARSLNSQWHLNKLIAKLRHFCLSVTDYVFQAKLIEFFANLFSNEKERFVYYMEFVNLLPENLQIVRNAYNLGLKMGEIDKCYEMFKSLISNKHYKLFDASIWKSVISLAIDRKDHFNVHRYFQLALSNHPYNKLLWRLILIYESSLNHRDHLKELRSTLEKLKLPNKVQQNKNVSVEQLAV